MEPAAAGSIRDAFTTDLLSYDPLRMCGGLMGKYIAKRMLHLVGILIALSFLTFLLMYLAPGDAATKKLNAQGIAVSQEVLEQTRKAMGLDRPFLVQYGDWAVHVLRGDLGNSYKDGQSVAGKLGKAQKYSLARSGSVGGGSKCDVRIKGMGLKNPHFEYEITRRTLQITPASGGDVRMPGDKSARAGTFSVAQGQHILAGRAEMCFQLSKPRAAARSPLNKRVYREK